MDLVEEEVRDAALEGAWGLAFEEVLLPGLMWVEGEVGFRDVATTSVVPGPLVPCHISSHHIPCMEKHHLPRP